MYGKRKKIFTQGCDTKIWYKIEIICSRRLSSSGRGYGKVIEPLKHTVLPCCRSECFWYNCMFSKAENFCFHRYYYLFIYYLQLGRHPVAGVITCITYIV